MKHGLVELDFERVFETIPGTGWLTKAEARLLWDWAAPCKGAILEVGSYHGRSTALLAGLGRKVHAVDPFSHFDSDDIDGDKTFAEFARNMTSRGLSNVIAYRQAIEDWSVVECGFAFLDGDHSYQGTIDQIEVALLCDPKRVAIHDVNDDGGGLEVKRAAVELLGAWADRVERLAVWEVNR